MNANISSVRFSVIMPVFNPTSSIHMVLDKVKNQTHANFEVIICDDGSDVDVEPLLANYLQDSRFQLVKISNSGPAAARHEGVKMAKNDHLVFLDSDDYVSPSWLRDFAIEFIDKNASLTSCGVVSSGTPSKFRHIICDGEAYKFNYLAGAFAVKRYLYNNCGGYNPQLRYSENWEIGYKLIRECHFRKLKVTVIEQYNMEYNRFVDGEKYERQNLERAQSSEILYNLYKSDVAMPKKMLMTWLELSAVNYYRVGKYEKSRKNLRLAIIEQPFKLKNYFRMAAGLVPFVGNLLWSKPLRIR